MPTQPDRMFFVHPLANTMHYGLRPIERCRNFGTLSLILFTSKYFRWKFHPCPSFLLHPNIPDRFIEAEMNIFWFSFSISLQNVRKKGMSWILSNILPKKLVHRYLPNTIFNLNINFTLNTVLLSNAILSFFHGKVYIFILQTIVAQRGRLQHFFFILL